MTNDITEIKVRRETGRIYLQHVKWTKDRRRNLMINKYMKICLTSTLLSLKKWNIFCQLDWQI